MGADFLYQVIPAAICSDERQSGLETLVRQLSDDDLVAFDEECFCGDYNPDDLDSRGKLIELLLGDVKEYWEIDGRRDTALLHLSTDQPAYFITGGMSWGDGPTATFDLMGRLIYIPGLFEILKAWAGEDLLTPKNMLENEPIVREVCNHAQ